MKKLIGALAALFLCMVGVIWAGNSAIATGDHHPSPTCIESEAHWQRYSWNGDVNENVIPPFPDPHWQANVQGDPHGVGAAGAYFRSHGGSGGGDWFYLQWVPGVTCETPTPTPMVTQEPTPTPTDTPTPTETPCPTPTPTPSETTPTPSPTPSDTPTETPTPTPTQHTPSPTPSETQTPAPSPTSSVIIPVPTETPGPTSTASSPAPTTPVTSAGPAAPSDTLAATGSEGLRGLLIALALVGVGAALFIATRRTPKAPHHARNPK